MSPAGRQNGNAPVESTLMNYFLVMSRITALRELLLSELLA